VELCLQDVDFCILLDKLFLERSIGVLDTNMMVKEVIVLTEHHLGPSGDEVLAFVHILHVEIDWPHLSQHRFSVVNICTLVVLNTYIEDAFVGPLLITLLIDSDGPLNLLIVSSLL